MKLKRDYFKEEVRKQFLADGNSMYAKNGELIIKHINDARSKQITPVKITDMMPGKFYFLMYDLSGKSSDMEKFSPILMLEVIDKGGSKKMYGISLNFIPVAIRTVFFNMMFNYNLDVLEKNAGLPINKEFALQNINFANCYNLLKDIGFEWAIREFNLLYINKVYNVSTNLLVEYITMSTAKITKVDDLKLIEIWKKKLETQQERERKLIASIIGDYNKMADELDKKFASLDERNENLAKSINTLNRII